MKVFTVKGLLVAGALLALGAGGAAAVLVLRLPPVPSQIPAAPMIVTLIQPANGSGAGAGSTVRVSAQAVAPHPVVMMELLADSLSGGGTAPTSIEENIYTASLEWSPSPGPHVLIVRATDDQGHIGLSNVVRVDGLVATDSMEMQPFVARGGETIEELAQTFGTTVPAIQTYNGGLSEGQALEPGQELSIPIPTHYDATWGEPSPAAPLPQDIGAAAQISPLSFWLGTAFSPVPSAPPAPSDISAAAQGCDVSLAVADNSVDEAGFFLYRLGQGSPAFERIATLGPHDGDGLFSFIDAQLSGTYTYYASAFNPAGESPGPMAQVTLPSAACGTAEWSGDLSLVGSLLASPIVADQAYFYASANGGQWRRVPSDPNAFLPAVQGGYDVSPFLADLAAGAGGAVTTLSLDGWGWGGGRLAHLGQGSANFSSGNAGGNLAPLYSWTALQGSHASTLSGDPSMVAFYSDKIIFKTPASFIFRWKTGSPVATSARWEVSKSPYFLPASIVAEGVEELEPAFQEYSYFHIAFDDLLALTAKAGDQGGAPIMQGPVPFGSEQALKLSAGQSVAFAQADPEAFWPGGGQSLGDAVAAGSLLPIGAGVMNEYYVRLTPMVGTQVVGEPSNTVVARYDPELDTTGGIQIQYLGPEYYTPLYEVEILDYTPGAAEDPNSWGCVEVVKVEGGSYADSLGWKVGMKQCPPSYKGAGYQGWKGVEQDLGKAGGWLKKGLNWASKAWQDIKAYAVKLMLMYTPLGLQCQFAEAVVLPEGTCQKVFAVGVDIALTSMGIPPTIPNFDKLMDEGLDYAVELAAQEALKEVPACVGPCEEAVKDKIREVLEAAIDEVAGQSVAPSCVSEVEAHENGREPWCPPSGLVVRPALGAVDSPPTIVVRLTRRLDVPDPANLPVCYLDLGAAYTIHGWNANYPEFSADPFGGGSLPIPPLAPGQSIQVAAALNDRRIVDFPWKSYVGDPYAFHDWGNMVWYGTSHARASAGFVIPPGYAQSSPPSLCAPVVTSEEKGAQSKGWKLK